MLWTAKVDSAPSCQIVLSRRTICPFNAKTLERDAVYYFGKAHRPDSQFLSVP